MALDARPELTVLDAAGLCAERGLHVIPVWRPTPAGACTCPRGAQCISPGKHPAIDSWQTAASTDLTILRDWFAPPVQVGDPDRYNIGVVCGTSNVVVIDIDPRNGGNDTFAALTNELGPLPDTVTADSGGGGTHYVLRRPTGELESKLGKGVDLLRDSRQFLVEPSLHPSGGMYRWRAGRAPDEIGVATLPQTWIARVRRQTKPRISASLPTDARVDRARKYLARLPAAVSGDNGHTQTFNAVATVMFGFDLDEDTAYGVIANDYNPRCDPPWSERELRHKIKSCAKTCSRERGYLLQSDRRPVTTTQQAADAAPVQPDNAADDWTAELITKRDGSVKKGYHNVEIFVRLFPDYRGKWSLNTMTGEPWFDGAPVRETFVHSVRAHADRRLGFAPSVSDVIAAISVAAESRQFHPIRQYLDSVDWDGSPRLASMARDYLNSDSPLHAEMVRRWMIGCTARALCPGCKLDTALMLYGPQGYFKSTFFAILGGQWHSDSAIDINNKDSYQQIHAAWIYEFAELENVVHGRAESRLKAFMASTHDTFRAPYARAVLRRPRGVAICGTTNRQQILTDDTGSRRFWIVPVTQPVDRDELTHARDQLWAEARAAYEAGEPWWLDHVLERAREDANTEFEDDDPWREPIGAWLARPALRETTVSEVLSDAIKLDVSHHDRPSQMRAGRVLKTLGWTRIQVRTGNDRRWVYRRPVVQQEANL